MVDVTEAFVDQRDKQVDEDVHAEDVPADEKRSRPLRATTVTFEVSFPFCTVRLVDVGIIFHELVPALTHTHGEQEDECFGYCPEILVGGLVRAESGETERLCKRDGVDEEQNEPCSEQVRDGCQTCRCGLKELIKLVVARNEHEGDRYQEELMQLNEHSLVAPSKDENGSGERAGDGEDGVHVPGAPAESVPCETNDTNDHISNEHTGQSEEDVVCRSFSVI